MPLSNLSITNLRNLNNVELVLSDGLNLFYGDNGAGKTSILEAISYLGLGRSFKSRIHKSLIGPTNSSVTVYGKGLVSLADALPVPFSIGVTRFGNRKKNQTLINGGSVNHSSNLADLLPVQWIDSESFNLLVGPPNYRRSYLDWIMFHVKHDFRSLFYNFQNAVKQRNALLRRDKIDRQELNGWDKQCALHGTELHNFRIEFLPELLNEISRLMAEHAVFGKEQLTIGYSAGWDTKIKLFDALQDSFQRDKLRGFTTIGPHKADLTFKISDTSISERFSRGQLKAAVYALYSAQLELVSKKTGKQLVCLLDDLPAELDEQNRSKLLQWLENLNIQCYVTGINKSELLKGWSPSLINSAKLFHVKHGLVTEKPISGEIHD